MAAVQPVIIPIRQAERPRATAGRAWLSARQRWHQAKLAARWWFSPHTPYQPTFVLATHRTGSNLLMGYLCHLPGVQCRSEVLCTTLPFGLAPRQCRPGTALQHIRRSLHTLRSPVRACKLMLDQLQRTALSVDALVAAFPEARFLILYRESLAEQYVSHELAKATQQWYLVAGQERRQTRIYVSSAKLKTFCEDVRRSYRDLLNHAELAGRSVLLSYEDLSADPSWWLSEQICPLLGVAAAPPRSHLCKQNVGPLSERVENYREVAALLSSPLCQQRYHRPRRSALRYAA